MSVNIRTLNDVTIIDLQGNIDINASGFVEAVGAVMRQGPRDVVCNFENVNLVDYVGVSIIAICYKNILNHEGTMKLCAVPIHVAKLFSIVGLDRVFNYYTDEKEAVEAINKEKGTVKNKREHLRRRFKRIELNIPAEYKELFSKDSPFFKGKILNLSAEGIFLSAPKLFQVGDLLSLRVNLRPYPGLLDLPTRVAWVADKEIQNKDWPAMGLEFFDITPKIQEDIITFVERHISRFTR
jgi:anti-anti-sigma factor